MVNKMLVGIVAAIVVIAVLVPVVYIVTKAPEKPKKHVPVAKFTATPTSVLHNKTVNFNGVASTDPKKSDIPKLTYSWSFGDGGTGTGVTILHKFVKDGSYTVILTVSDGKYSNSTSQVIQAYNVAPKISDSSPVAASLSLDEGQSQLLSITVSDDNLDTLAVSWIVDNKLTTETTSKYNFTTNFSSAGIHNAKVVVTDGKLNVSKTWVITVVNVNRAPTLQIILPALNFSMAEGETKLLEVSAIDPDGDNLTFIWKLDDLKVKNGTALSSNYSYSPTFADNGTHLIQVSYSDGYLSVIKTWKIVVTNVNRAPIIGSFSPLSDVTMMETASKDFIINATDPDGDTLAYNWTLNGVPVGTNLKTYQFVTNYTSNGTYVLIGKVQDISLSAQHRWNITVQNLNRAPTAAISADFTTRNITELFQFNGSGSSDPDSDLLTYSWQFGDGNVDTGLQVTHSYALPGTYKVNLTVTDPFGANSMDSLDVTVLQPLPSLNQLFQIGPSSEQYSALVIADVDNDGDQEMVVGSDGGTDWDNITHGYLYIYDVLTQAEEWKSADIGAVTALAAANLDADPALEIVVGLETSETGFFNTTMYGKVLLIDGTSHNVEKTGLNLGMITTIYVADINADTTLEIVAGYEYNMSINLVTFNMSAKGGIIVYDPNLAIKYNSTGWGASSVVVLENMDADVAVEMVALSMKSVNLLSGVLNANISSFEWSANKPVQKGTLLVTSSNFMNAFAVGDLDADGIKEVFIGDSGNATGSSTYTGNVTILTQELGAKHKITGLGGVESILVANIYGTGMDIIVGIKDTDDGENFTGKFIVYDSTYAELWHTDAMGAVMMLASGDINGDSEVEIIATSTTVDDGFGGLTTTLYVFSSTTHDILYEIDGLHDVLFPQFTIVDVDGDGIKDLVFFDWNSGDSEAYFYAYKVE
jgi:PKD repeat protein